MNIDPSISKNLPREFGHSWLLTTPLTMKSRTAIYATMRVS